MRRVAEQRGISDAAGIERVEHDAGIAPALVELAVHDHARQLAVFISLAGLERLAVNHRDGRLEACGQPGQIAEFSRRRDWHLAAEFLAIGGDSAQRDQAGRPGQAALGLFQIIQQQMRQQEVAEIIGGNADFIAFGGTHRRFEARQIDGGVQQQRIKRQAKAVKFIGEAAYAGLIAQINMQDPARIGGDANLSGCGFRLGQIAACHDHQPTPIRQGLGSPQAHARRSASYDRRWLNSSLD